MSTKNISQTSPLEFFDEEPIMPCDETCPLDIIAKEVVEEEMNNYKETWKRIAQDDIKIDAVYVGSTDEYIQPFFIVSKKFDSSTEDFEIIIRSVRKYGGTQIITSKDFDMLPAFLTKESYIDYVENTFKQRLQPIADYSIISRRNEILKTIENNYLFSIKNQLI